MLNKLITPPSFGMVMQERSFSSPAYRWGFNGKEKDEEVKGEGNQQDYGFRIYDTRVGKFLSLDPLTKKYPELTTYQFSSNNPVENIDLDGLEGQSSKLIPNSSTGATTTSAGEYHEPHLKLIPSNFQIINQNESSSSNSNSSPSPQSNNITPNLPFGGSTFPTGNPGPVVFTPIDLQLKTQAKTTFNIPPAIPGPLLNSASMSFSTGTSGLLTKEINSQVSSNGETSVVVSNKVGFTGLYLGSSPTNTSLFIGSKINNIGQAKIELGIKNGLTFTAGINSKLKNGTSMEINYKVQIRPVNFLLLCPLTSTYTIPSLIIATF